MDAFSLLRYWRTNNAIDGTNNANLTTSTATTIVTSVSTQTSETGDEEAEEGNEKDHGPFFDLEFSLPAQGEERGVEEHENNDSDYGEEDEDEDSDGSERELRLTVLSNSSGDSTSEVNVSGSPSDELFFRGGFVPVERTTEIDSKPPQFRLPLMKSATKFRVMMLKFRKAKLNAESSEGTESNASASSSNFNEEQKKNEENEKPYQNGECKSSGKSMTVKLKVEEVPIVSLFKRHNSSKPSKKQQNDNETISGSTDEKKFSKETMQKYLRKVKISGEKLKFTGQLSFPRVIKPNSVHQKTSPVSNPDSDPPLVPTNAKGLKQQVSLPAKLRVVRKHLGKSWSGSTPVAAAAPPGAIPSKRRDDSLIQQQDGIQSAILHCKRSFKALRDDDCPAEDSGECENRSCSDAADVKETEELKKR